MSTKMELGRLQQVDLRQAWENEGGDFTPWLASEQNIVLLGESLALDLEVEAQEKNVGPFRADILCKDTATGDWVLIENQLQKTDHGHLGQILTYAAGLQAVTIVWIAERFTDEHRAALDWLNEITDERFSFFGLEIELWRIGASPVAPKFNIISKPNDWTKTPPKVATVDTPTKQLQLEYWTAFREYAAQEKSHLKIQKPLPQHWTNIAIGRANIYMAAVVNTRDKEVVVQLVLASPAAKAQFKQLEAQKADIEAEAATALDWRVLPHRKQSHVVLTKAADPNQRDQWPVQQQWLLQTLEVFHRVFAKRVKLLTDSNEPPMPVGEVPA
jgi:hypothetical protein